MGFFVESFSYRVYAAVTKVIVLKSAISLIISSSCFEIIVVVLLCLIVKVVFERFCECVTKLL